MIPGIRSGAVRPLLGLLVGAALGAAPLRAQEMDRFQLDLSYRDLEGRPGTLLVTMTGRSDGFDAVVSGISGISSPKEPFRYSKRGEIRVLKVDGRAVPRNLAPHHLRELVGETPVRVLDLEKIDLWLRSTVSRASASDSSSEEGGGVVVAAVVAPVANSAKDRAAGAVVKLVDCEEAVKLPLAPDGAPEGPASGASELFAGTSIARARIPVGPYSLPDGSCGVRRELKPGPENGGAWWEARLRAPSAKSR